MIPDEAASANEPRAMTYKMNRKLSTLDRRVGYLSKAIANKEGSANSLDRDRSELSALEFAIETIRAHYRPFGSDHQ